MTFGNSKYIQTNSINLHYIHFKGNGPLIIFMHGLSSNAHAFNGLVDAGICSDFEILAIDLRGRGLSDKPESGYSIKDHALDIVGIINQISPDQAVMIGGHSFGGLVAMYLAAHYPDYVSKVILIDSGARFHPYTAALLKPIRNRLGRVFSSFTEYVNYYNEHNILGGTWNTLVKNYLEADAEIRPDGTILAYPKPKNIDEVAEKLVLEDWDGIAKAIHQPALLLKGADGFGTEGSPPIITEEGAKETVSMLPNGKYVKVKGAHLNMMWEGATEMVKAIKNL